MSNLQKTSSFNKTGKDQMILRGTSSFLLDGEQPQQNQRDWLQMPQDVRRKGQNYRIMVKDELPPGRPSDTV